MYLVFYAAVDEDGSGKIEFDEFLGIMLNIKRGNATGKISNSAMFDFFKRNLTLIQGSAPMIWDPYTIRMSVFA